jgi:leucyl/phenylalanyl-tRNA--protein transferase
MLIDPRAKQLASLFRPGEDAETARAGHSRRNHLFQERPGEAARRLMAATARLLRPRTGGELSEGLGLLLRARRGPAGLPDPAAVSSGPRGVTGFVNELDAGRLMEGYARGLQLGLGPGRMTWRSPASRLVAPPATIGVPKRVRGHLRRRRPAVTLDRDFEQVIVACARSGPAHLRPLWLSPRAMHLFGDLFDTGFAHSFEVWDDRQQLIAGGIGVAVGQTFVTQAMFGAIDHWVELGQVVLNRHLHRFGFALHDGLADTRLRPLGFAPVTRDAYLTLLFAHAGAGRIGRWEVEADLCGPGLPGPAQRRAEAPALTLVA